MASPKQGVEYKVKLLRHLLSNKSAHMSPDISSFWEHAAQSFPEEPKRSADELEEFCDQDVQTWSEERNNPRKKRRVGHEAGTEYDRLMDQWIIVWDAMLIDHWEWTIQKGAPKSGGYDKVPQEFRDKVKARIEAKRSLGHKAQPLSGCRPASHRKVQSPTFEYDGAKLMRVVEAAKLRAMETGKPDLAAAVNQVYEDALKDPQLRFLLEAILTQTASSAQSEQFQEHVREAKKKLREQKSSGIKVSKVPVQLAKGVDASQTGPAAENEGDSSTIASGDSLSGVVSDSADASEAKEKAVNKDREGLPESKKRRRDSPKSLVGADDEDLVKADQATKRRKRAETDADGDYHPSKEKAPAAHRASRPADIQKSRESSIISKPAVTNSEAGAEDASVDGIVGGVSAEALREVIDVEIPPASSIVDDSNASRLSTSTTLRATNSNDKTSEQETTTGPEHLDAQSNTDFATLPGPPTASERITTEEGNHAYKIITGAAAEAVNPALLRLEGKIDRLISDWGLDSEAVLRATSHVKPCNSSELAPPALQDVASVTEVMQSSDLNINGPEMISVISQLAQRASEASINAAEAARHASTVARQASQILMRLASQNLDERATTSGRKKK